MHPQFAELSLYATGFHNIWRVSLSTHITTGFLAILLGLVAIFTRKGGGGHRLSGKLSMALMLLLVITAFTLLILDGVIPLASSTAQRKDLMWMLSILLLAAIYPIIQGYRWSISHKPKLDTDIPMALMTLFTAIVAFINIPIDVIFRPFISTDVEFLMTPATAGLLLFFIGAISIYFFIDDLKTYLRNKVSRQEQISKHVYRSMTAFGAAATAVCIVIFSPLMLSHHWAVWPIYIVPPALLAMPTAYFAFRSPLTAKTPR